MKSVNALAVRKSLGAVLDQMRDSGQPVLVTRDRKVAAALVPIELFRSRFTDLMGREAVEASLAELRSIQVAGNGTSTEALADLRRS